MFLCVLRPDIVGKVETRYAVMVAEGFSSLSRKHGIKLAAGVL